MFELALISTIFLLVGFTWEFWSYCKAKHSIWEVMIHLVIDCVGCGFVILVIWLLYMKIPVGLEG